jgi:hypothetical protein
VLFLTKLTTFINIKKGDVNLCCAPNVHDKLPKTRKLAFNDVKYLIVVVHSMAKMH